MLALCSMHVQFSASVFKGYFAHFCDFHSYAVSARDAGLLSGAAAVLHASRRCSDTCQ